MAKKVMIFVLSVLIFSSVLLFSKESRAAYDCLKITSSSSQAEKDYCKAELVRIEAELAELLAKQKEQQKQTGTIRGDVDYLTSQINALKTKIKSRSMVIAELKVSIKEKVTKIDSLSEKIKREHESLAELLRNTNEYDNNANQLKKNRGKMPGDFSDTVTAFRKFFCKLI